MNKKKAGILTFHDADNLGAVLQAFALKNVLENECGVTAEIVDYKCRKITETKYPQKPDNFKKIIKTILLSVYYAIKRHGFDLFRKNNLGHSNQVFTRDNIKNSENHYDFFITGSDQVWNPLCSDRDLTYVLDFVTDKNKKFSYAASIGNYEFTASDCEWIGRINDYKRISVRERYAAQQLEKNGISNISVNLDPVLLLYPDQWKNIMSGRIIKQRYVLVYQVLPDVNVTKQAYDYAKKNNCKVINNKKSVEFFLHNSPADFLSWVYYSECVFTNSFHGTAFSLIFNKKLFSDVENADGTVNHRINDLLNATQMLGCSELRSDSNYPVALLNNTIVNMRNESVNYLKDICNI